jgi:predicted metalloprotease with PDZ domain
MRSRFSGEKGFSREDLRTAVAEIAGPAHAREIRAWMGRALETTAELDYTDAMAWFGLRMTPPAAAPRAYLGVTTRTENGKTIITGIRRGSPAAAAGMSLGDEIAAINGEPLAAGQLTQRLEGMAPASKVTLTITRGGATRTMNIVLATDPGHGWQLSALPVPTRPQSQHLDAWLTTP